jgi:RNA polymerase sigma-70 factor, ECF subfamily
MVVAVPLWISCHPEPKAKDLFDPRDPSPSAQDDGQMWNLTFWLWRWRSAISLFFIFSLTPLHMVDDGASYSNVNLMTNQQQICGVKPISRPIAMTIEELRRMVGLWVDDHNAAIYRFLIRLSRNTQLAEDLTQETFLRAFRSSLQLRDLEAVRPWLYRIAWNAYLDHRRSERARGRPAEVVAELSAFKDTKPDAESKLLGLELSCRLRKIVDRLPSRQRSVFVLRAGDQMSYEEIALCLNCSVVAARSHFRHALNKIRKECRREGLHL